MDFSGGKAAVSVLFGNQVDRIATSSLEGNVNLDLAVNILAGIGAQHIQKDTDFRKEWDATIAALENPEAARGVLAPRAEESTRAWRLRVRGIQFTALVMAGVRCGLLDKTPRPMGNWKGVTESEVQA